MWVLVLLRYKGSASYCRCSAISLRSDSSHINHFSQINTEQDTALLHHSIEDGHEHDGGTSCLQVGFLSDISQEYKEGSYP